MDNKKYLNNKISDKLYNFYGSILTDKKNINKWNQWRFFYNKAKQNYNIIENFSTFKKGFEIYTSNKNYDISTKLIKGNYNTKTLHFQLKIKVS